MQYRKHKYTLWLILATLINPLFQALSQEVGNDSAQIWVPGEVDHNLIASKSGELWFGLFPRVDGFDLVESSITYTSDETRTRVSVADTCTPILLMRNIVGLHHGRVKTIFWGSWQMQNRGQFFLSLEETQSYTLSVSRWDDEGDGKTIIMDYLLGLNHNITSQTIVQLENIETSQSPSIVWAGDLDSDKKLDLLLEIPDSISSHLALFLSSYAETGELVRKIAEYQFVVGE
jgi:hypothetical protein